MKKTSTNTTKQSLAAKNKFISTYNTLKKLHFFRIKQDIFCKLEELDKLVTDFFVDRSILDLLSRGWNETDYVFSRKQR